MVVGEIRLAPTDSTDIPQVSAAETSGDGSMLLSIAVAIGLGIGASLAIMRSTSKAAERSRQLRQSKQTIDVHELATLENHPQPAFHKGNHNPLAIDFTPIKFMLEREVIVSN